MEAEAPEPPLIRPSDKPVGSRESLCEVTHRVGSCSVSEGRRRAGGWATAVT